MFRVPLVAVAGIMMFVVLRWLWGRVWMYPPRVMCRRFPDLARPSAEEMLLEGPLGPGHLTVRRVVGPNVSLDGVKTIFALELSDGRVPSLRISGMSPIVNASERRRYHLEEGAGASEERAFQLEMLEEELGEDADEAVLQTLEDLFEVDSLNPELECAGDRIVWTSKWEFVRTDADSWERVLRSVAKLADVLAEPIRR